MVLKIIKNNKKLKIKQLKNIQASNISKPINKQISHKFIRYLFINIMSDCSIDHSDYKNNGLITKIWGGPGWIFNHSITFGYPINPTDIDKIKYKNYFMALGDVLPCRYCRESYLKFITTGETALTNEVLENREKLTMWFYRVHNAVNAKLEVDYGVTYENLVDKYESFRARCGKSKKGCIAPLDYKAFSFKKLYQIDAPIVSLDIVKKFVLLAKKRKLNNSAYAFLPLAEELNGNFNLLKKQSSWPERNAYCQDKIKYMRENAISSIEESGPWKGTPTPDELELLMFLSSNLNKSELILAVHVAQSILHKS